MPAPHHSSQGLLAKPGDHPGLQQGGAQGDGTWLARSAGLAVGGSPRPRAGLKVLERWDPGVSLAVRGGAQAARPWLGCCPDSCLCP